MKKIAILQSNYIPWKGYFDIINDVDLFVFYDEVQYTKNDWRNRNKIYTENGLKWLTLPCGYNLHLNICDTLIKSEINWQKEHFTKIHNAYNKAPHYDKYKDFLEYIYVDTNWSHLYKLNRFIIKYIAKELLGSTTKFVDSREFSYDRTEQNHRKLLSLLKEIGATTYLSGPAAKGYIVPEEYEKEGIKLEWKNYEGYPIYKQRYEPFEHNVSMLDLLFNVGEDSSNYIWGWRNRKINSGGGVFKK